MKRFFTFLLFGLALSVLPLAAQDDDPIDGNYVFVDENGTIIENGSTVIRNVTATHVSGREMISSGIWVKNVSAPANMALRMNYEIVEIDNGSFQLCFPTTCNEQSEVGFYQTTPGSVEGTRDIECEWFPDDDGTCTVKLTLEAMTKTGGFPPKYVHSGTGATITVKFVKEAPIDGNYVFVDENGTLIENGSTVIRNVTATHVSGREMISSGIWVKNVSAPANMALKMNYEIVQLDNGSFQLCFPTTCNEQTEVGFYETTPGPVEGTKDIECEWFPDRNGICVANLALETMTRTGGFPPKYVHSGFGARITVKFIKKIPGDVNGDGEVGLGDINYLIDLILSPGSADDSADVNNDGEITVADINAVIDIILTPVS